MSKPNFGIGKTSTRKNIRGAPFTFKVEDAVGFQVGKEHKKYICLQRLKHLTPKERIEYRFAYYMVGVKEGAKGRWVFGQYALMIGPKQLQRLLLMAVKKWPDFSELIPNCA
ncbi:MAG: hypothetical protein OJF60_002413 [Burkholderiaceae bacterium]|nr:MAG: hypothetical protein OJF60_002413 [Burkholderiaceae bacterium]